MKKSNFWFGMSVTVWLILVPAAIEAQSLPDWVKNPPKATNDTIHAVGKGKEQSLEGAKGSAFRDMWTELFPREIAIGGNSFLLNVTRTDSDR